MSQQMDDSKALEIWKSKSLNSMPTQPYKIWEKTKQDTEEVSLKKNPKGSKQTTEDTAKTIVPTRPPEPRTIKLSEQLFCMYLYNELNVFKYLNDEQKKYWKKQKKCKGSFGKATKILPSDIKFVLGNGKHHICVGLKDSLFIFKMRSESLTDDDGKPFTSFEGLQLIKEKEIKNLKRAVYLKQNNDVEYLVAFSTDKFYKCKVQEQKDYPVVKQTKINFHFPNDFELYSKGISISLLVPSPVKLFMFLRIQGKIKVQNEEEKQEDKYCESLYIATFFLQGRELGDSVSAKISGIDHIFEDGIFGRSKVFQLADSVFLLSLHEQIVVIKEHFDEYVVWDNIALAPSKSSGNKGQLVLANKIVMVYTEMGQIYAQNIAFWNDKLKTPKIDNFKGNDNDEEMLYDAIVLQYQPGSFMKVLIYLKRAQVFSPAPIKPGAVRLEEGSSGEKTGISVTMLCIQQDNPEKKLQQLFKNKKPPQVISEFVERFKIDDLTKSKCQWSVSEKNEKDIEGLLLEIKDNEYIQEQLTMILKQSPHDLKFLLMIERKQKQRYKKMLVTKLLKLDNKGENPKGYSPKERQYILSIIQWLMESIMFEKKLAYSQNFLEFKEYDFIEIGKLKAASLKEQIKLLSCKGFEKRLKYFMNSFKYMVLFIFEDIFSFLIEDKNEFEVEEFFTKGFSFILPNFQENSEIFRRKKGLPSIVFQKQNALVARREQIQSTLSLIDYGEECVLWEDKFHEREEIRKIETVGSFKESITEAIMKEKDPDYGISCRQAVQNFYQILEEFMSKNWFLHNKSKQHSILTTTIQELKNKFEYLKKIGVFHIMIRIFYEKIYEGIYKEDLVKRILNTFAKEDKVPLSFVSNIKARRMVYDSLEEKMNVKKPILSEFLVMDETKYFKYLFENYREKLLESIKDIYERIQHDFFREKFQIYLSSQEIELRSIINFLDLFENNINDDIRFDVFTSIKRILKISDKQNTQNFVEKLMNKQILKNKREDYGLIDEAKIVFGVYFFQFFDFFKLDYYYKELIYYTFENVLEKNKFILSILEKYSSEYQNYAKCSQSQVLEDGVFSHTLQFKEYNGIQGIQAADLGLPSEFMGIVFFLKQTLEFPLSSAAIFNELSRLFLQNEQTELFLKLNDQMTLLVNAEGDDDLGTCHKHIELLQQFKRNDDYFPERPALILMRWIREKYMKVPSVSEEMILQNEIFLQMGKKIEEINSLFAKIDNYFIESEKQNHLSGMKIQREKFFLKMLMEIYKFHSGLLFYVIPQRYIHFTEEDRKNFLVRSNYAETTEDLDEQSLLLTQLDSFIFMMRLFKLTNLDKFNKTDTTSIKQDIVYLYDIHAFFISASYYEPNQRNTETGFIRFCIEVATQLIENKYFEYALEVLLKSINNQDCHFRDVFYHFFSSISVPNINLLKTFIGEFVKIQSKKSLQNKVMSFITEYSINRFEEDKDRMKQMTEEVFSTVLNSNRMDEAFYFLIRNSNLQITKAISICQQKFGSSQLTNILSYALISIYLKCLKYRLCTQFYPNYSFYINKRSMLMNEHQRKDIIKDINIAISRMKQTIIDYKKEALEIERRIKEGLTEQQIDQILTATLLDLKAFDDTQSNTRREEEKKKFIKKMKQNKKKHEEAIEKIKIQQQELEKIYIQFMLSMGLDPKIKLNQSQMKEAREKLDDMSRNIPPADLEGHSLRNIKEANAEAERKEQEQIQYQMKKKKVREEEADRVHLFSQKINEQLAETKRKTEKYEQYNYNKEDEEIKKAEEAMSNYEKLKEREKSEIQSIKDSYKSKNTEKVEKMLEEMRVRRARLLDRNQDPSKYSGISIDESKSRSNYQVNIISPSHDKLPEPNQHQSTKNLFLPITMNQNQDSASNYSSRKDSFNIKEGPQKKVFGKISPLSSYKSIPISQQSNRKQSIAQIVKLFEEREPQCKKYVEKLQFIKSNLEVGLQLTKSIYQSIYNFDIFLKYLKFLCEFNPSYKTIIEEKAIKIAQQSINIQFKYSLKQLFSFEFFTTVSTMPLKQYYKNAFELLKPNLIKILKKPDAGTFVHGLGVLFRFGFGAENVYYHKVYEQYTRLLLTEYANGEYDDAKVYQMAIKILNYFKNISAQNQEYKFETMMREISNENKRKRMAKNMLKVLEGRSGMLIGQNSSEIKNVMMRLS